MVPPIVYRAGPVPVGTFPAGVAAHRHARGADHLIGGDIEVDDERAELAVEFTRRIERVLLPAKAIVDHHFRIPLGKVEAAALPSLPPGQRRRTGIPTQLDRHRFVGRKRTRQREADDRAVGCKGVGRHDR
jgi:hypothetical protein